jgi:transposase
LQRVEIITGAGRRRRFSRDTKARIVLESRAPGAVISEVARRHGLTPQQLFAWRRELRATIAGSDVPTAATTTFTPVVVVAS